MTGGRDLGGFDTNSWQPRDDEKHKEIGFELLKCRTQEELSTRERSSGARYSELFRLPYFKPVQMHVIDPMHNLFLGMNISLSIEQYYEDLKVI